MKPGRQATLALLVPVAVTAWLFAPLLGGALGASTRFLEWDVPEQYWPDLVYLCGALREGTLPYWNPFDRAGYPYYADPQAGIYNPLNWAICAVAGRSPSLAWAEARVVLGFLSCGMFGLLWLRRWGLPWGAAVLGSTILQAAPFMRHNWELNLTTAFAWAPLVLWAADRAVVERRARDGAVLALSVALCAWVGSPPALWLCLCLAAPFTAWRLAEATIDSARPFSRPALLGSLRHVLAPAILVLALASILSLGLTGAVLGPGLRLASYSIQAGRGLESIAEQGLSPGDLLALVRPLPGNHIYVGLVALALAALGLFSRSGPDSPRLPARWFFAIASIAAVLMTLGTDGPVFGLAYDLVPGVSLFRLPHRYEAWLGPCTAALAAAGLAWIDSPLVAGRIRSRPTALRICCSAISAAGLIWMVLAGVKGVGAVRESIAFAGVGPGALLAGLGLAGIAASVPGLGASHAVTGALLAALLLLDVSQTLPADRHTVPRPHPGSAAAAAPILALAQGTDSRFRYMDEFGISLRSGTRFARRDFRGYQDPLLLKSYERILASLGDHPGLAEQFGVKYALTGPHFIHGWNRHFLPPPGELLARPGAADLGSGVIELSRALPPSFWVDASLVRRAHDRPAALEMTKRIAPCPIAILDGAATGFDSGSFPRYSPDPPAANPSSIEGDTCAGTGGPIEAEDWSLGRDTLSFTLDAPGHGMVVVNEAWYPGWKATVDGKSVPVWRANALVRAVPVGPGRHSIAMRFRPADGIALRWLLLVSLAATLALAIGGSRSQVQLSRRNPWTATPRAVRTKTSL